MWSFETLFCLFIYVPPRTRQRLYDCLSAEFARAPGLSVASQGDFRPRQAVRNEWPRKVGARSIEGTCGSFAENIRYFDHLTQCQNRCFWSRNTISIVMDVVYMNIETLIVINKCLPRTKILLLRHLKTKFATKKWKTVKFAPSGRPLDNFSKVHDIPAILSHFASIYRFNSFTN